jgi:hypothetical protein
MLKNSSRDFDFDKEGNLLWCQAEINVFHTIASKFF